MIVDPPLSVGAVHVNATCVLPAVPATDVGASGTVRGVTADDAVDAAPLPATLTALTRNVYAVPFDRPVTVTDVAVDAARVNVVQIVPFGEDWTR